MRQKGQAALEFLTTYAWAFLVILIMIAALAYFGVLRPTNILPDRCTFSAGIECSQFLIDGDESNDGVTTPNEQFVLLRLKNSLGEPIVIANPSHLNFVLRLDGDPGGSTNATTWLTECGTAAGGQNGNMSVDGNPFPVAGLTWATGESHDFRWTKCDDDHGTVVGEKTKFFVDINYYPARSGSTFTKTVSGEIFGRVQS